MSDLEIIPPNAHENEPFPHVHFSMGIYVPSDFKLEDYQKNEGVTYPDQIIVKGNRAKPQKGEHKVILLGDEDNVFLSVNEQPISLPSDDRHKTKTIQQVVEELGGDWGVLRDLDISYPGALVHLSQELNTPFGLSVLNSGKSHTIVFNGVVLPEAPFFREI